jgi:hypothetical protein
MVILELTGATMEYVCAWHGFEERFPAVFTRRWHLGYPDDRSKGVALRGHVEDVFMEPGRLGSYVMERGPHE